MSTQNSLCSHLIQKWWWEGSKYNSGSILHVILFKIMKGCRIVESLTFNILDYTRQPSLFSYFCNRYIDKNSSLEFLLASSRTMICCGILWYGILLLDFLFLEGSYSHISFCFVLKSTTWKVTVRSWQVFHLPKLLGYWTVLCELQKRYMTRIRVIACRIEPAYLGFLASMIPFVNRRIRPLAARLLDRPESRLQHIEKCPWLVPLTSLELLVPLFSSGVWQVKLTPYSQI